MNARDRVVEAARMAIAVAYIGDGKVVCPRAFLEPLRELYSALAALDATPERSMTGIVTSDGFISVDAPHLYTLKSGQTVRITKVDHD